MRQTHVLGRSPGISGRARVPGSKSMTNRALVASALAKGTSRVTGGLEGDDADSMVAGLRLLGASIEDLGSGVPSWQVTGTAGRLSQGPITIDADLAGTTLRFVTAVAVLGRGGITVTGKPGLLARPVGPFLDALRSCGAAVTGSGPEGDHAPVVVGARQRPLGGPVRLDASQSSQFVTALLLVAPHFDTPLDLEVAGLGAGGFVDLTIEVMARYGVEVDRDGPALYRVPAGGGYRPTDYEVPPDASAASHLTTLAAAAGGEVTVERLLDARSQPDFGFLDVLEGFGVTVRADPSDGSVTVTGPDRLRPVDVDLRAMPDQLPNTAVLAALAAGTSRITGVGITRFHESDRMAAVAGELAKVGVRVDVEPDALVVHGGTARPGSDPFSVTLDSHDDHRLAMAGAALAAALGGIAVSGSDAVSKTYRDFWTDAGRLGLQIHGISTGRPSTHSGRSSA